MKYVYRVEDDYGVGPYHDGAWEINELGDRSTPERPIPEHDAGIERYINYGTEYCGFKSMAQLKQWFTQDDLERMYENGYSIVTYTVGEEVEITAVGMRQILFTKLCEREEQYDNVTG